MTSADGAGRAPRTVRCRHSEGRGRKGAAPPFAFHTVLVTAGPTSARRSQGVEALGERAPGLSQFAALASSASTAAGKPSLKAVTSR